MKAAYMAAVAAIAIIALVLTGCGGGGGGLISDLNSYLPEALGNNWTYDLRIRADLIIPLQIHPGWNEFTQTEEITGTAQFVGTDYFVFSVTREAAGEFPEANWTQYRRVDNAGVHARDLFEPVEITLLQTPPTVGDTWPHPTNANVTYETIATDEPVTVPAGTFDCAMVEMVDTTIYNDPISGDPLPSPFTIHTWLAKGVGVVQDRTYEGPTEDMTSEVKLREYEIL